MALFTHATGKKVRRTGVIVDRRVIRKELYDGFNDEDDDDGDDDNVVFLNVCGMTYETLKSTLNRFPETLLGDEKRRNVYYRKRKNAFDFDRHRQCFEAVLYYYQSGGMLMRPLNVPMEIFE